MKMYYRFEGPLGPCQRMSQHEPEKDQTKAKGANKTYRTQLIIFVILSDGYSTEG